MIAGSLYTITSLGFNLTFATSRFFNLAHGSLSVVGGYMFLLFSVKLGIPLWAGVICGVLSGGLAGVAMQTFVFAPLQKRRATNLVKLLASLGIMTMIQALFGILFSAQFQVLTPRNTSAHVYNVIGASVTNIQLWTFFTAVAATLGLMILLKKTLIGTAIRALSDDEEVAQIVGINTQRTLTLVFFIAGALAGIGGILFGLDTGIDPSIGMAMLLKGIIAAVIGGIGNVFGGMLGGFILGFFENFGIWKISAEWKDTIAFSLLILFLIFRPQGILKR